MSSFAILFSALERMTVWKWKYQQGDWGWAPAAANFVG